MLAITISRQTGSLGEETARRLAARLQIPLIDREYVHTQWLPEFTTPHERTILKESPKFHTTASGVNVPFYILIEDRLKDMLRETSAVILGLGAQVIYADHTDVLHVRICAPKEIRVERISKEYGIDLLQAERLMALSDRKHRRYLWEIYQRDWEDGELYHMLLNTGRLSVENAVEIISGTLSCMDKSGPDSNKVEYDGESDEGSDSKSPAFVHSSEEEFAGILDMYHIEWQYEPTTFPVEWDAEGNVTMAFSPDFYLPAYNTYIELTTMNQKYVTEKNKKVRRMRMLYPKVNIIILYKKDIHTLLRKFGIVEEE